MGRSARASDSSARQPRHQPPYNLLVSSPCFRGHVFITFSSSTRVVTVNNAIGYSISLLYHCYGARCADRKLATTVIYCSVASIRNNRAKRSTIFISFHLHNHPSYFSKYKYMFSLSPMFLTHNFYDVRSKNWYFSIYLVESIASTQRDANLLKIKLHFQLHFLQFF